MNIESFSTEITEQDQMSLQYTVTLTPALTIDLPQLLHSAFLCLFFFTRLLFFFSRLVLIIAEMEGGFTSKGLHKYTFLDSSTSLIATSLFQRMCSA